MVVRFLDIDIDLAERDEDKFCLALCEGIIERMKREQGGDFMTRAMPDPAKFHNIAHRAMCDHRAIVQYGAQSFDELENLYAGDRRQAQDAQRECSEWAAQRWDDVVVWNANVLWQHCVSELEAIHLYKGRD